MEMQDGVCIARKATDIEGIPSATKEAYVNAAAEIAFASEDEATVLTERLLAGLDGTRATRVRNVVNGIRLSKQLRDVFPQAQLVEFCDRLCILSNPRVCKHKFGGQHSYHGFRLCDRCNGIRTNSYYTIAEQAADSPSHLHARMKDETGVTRSALLYVYPVGTYVAQKAAEMPGEVLTKIKESPASMHSVATPEEIAGLVNVTGPRVRDPLLLAHIASNAYIIWRWE